MARGYLHHLSLRKKAQSAKTEKNRVPDQNREASGKMKSSPRKTFIKAIEKDKFRKSSSFVERDGISAAVPQRVLPKISLENRKKRIVMHRAMTSINRKIKYFCELTALIPRAWTIFITSQSAILPPLRCCIPTIPD